MVSFQKACNRIDYHGKKAETQSTQALSYLMSLVNTCLLNSKKDLKKREIFLMSSITKDKLERPWTKKFKNNKKDLT